MKIKFIVVDRTRSSFLKRGELFFLDRLKNYSKMEWHEVKPVRIIKGVNQEEIKKHGLSLNSDEGLSRALESLQHDINAFSNGGKYQNLFPERWLPSTIAVLPESFSEENHLVNSTMKLVRGRIYEYFRETLEFLYTPESRNIVNPGNIDALKKWISKA